MALSARKITLMGVLIALAIVLKLPILSIPNVEFLTFVIFSSGFLLGMIEGALVGVIVMSIYTTLIAPYGIPPFPIATAQVLSMGLIGFCGGVACKLNPVVRNQKASQTMLFIPTLAVLGLVMTLIYDLLTNFAVAWIMGQFWPIMVAAIPFALLHVISNVIIFLVLSPLLIRLSSING